ncbi:hypothetical protein JCM8547_008328 [Rhodosporidiobolus lusitaniae]
MQWQEQIRQSLLARDQREQANAVLISHLHRFAQQSTQLKDRNRALLNAATSSRGSGSGAGADNPVRAALVASLEQQLAQTRTDLSEQYKIQSTNAQRLLSLTDSLRDTEERSAHEREELRRLRIEVEGLKERQRWHREIVAEKEKQLLILQDDHTALSLELSQLEIEHENVKTDNAALLQRWLESKAEEANRMNEANTFLEEAKRARERNGGAAGGGGEEKAGEGEKEG